MFDELDEALRRLLIRELPIKNNEIDITFDLPKRDWSARLSRPTLNLFLYDVRENNKLRTPVPTFQLEHNPDGTVTQRRHPVRVDLRYMITAWAKTPEDEHRLLARTMIVLFRTPELPDEVLPEELQGQPAPITIQTAQYDTLDKPTDMWNVLDNIMRPAVACVITMAMNPFRPFVTPIVSTPEVRFRSPEGPVTESSPAEPASHDRLWTVGGIVHSQQPLETVRLVLVERGLDVPIGPEGMFVIPNLRSGEYTLEASIVGRPPTRHKITVPSSSYHLNV